MSEPVGVGELLPGVLTEVVDRAGHGYERWAELVAQAGYCHHPIRLAGRVEHADRQTGEVRTVYDSEREPDGVLLNDPAYVGVAVTSLPGRPGFYRVRTPQVDHHQVAAIIRAATGLRADPAGLLAAQAPGLRLVEGKPA